jgi:secreted PhoX family phosphatase
MHMRKIVWAVAVCTAGLAGNTMAGEKHHHHAAPSFDYGVFQQKQLRSFAPLLFGVARPVEASSTKSVDKPTAEAQPTSLITVAKSLRVHTVAASTDLGANIDMIAFWPNDKAPTHLIVCNEEGADKPGVQRVGLANGKVETILTGTVSCDPVRRTPWGTIIVGEETGPSGRLIEILDPLTTTGVIYDDATGLSSDPTKVVSRDAVGRLSFEGIALYPNGVMYYGDEKRPSNGAPGGSYFKFIPTTLWTGGGNITNLADSPLVAGKVYGLRLGLRSGGTDYGQGSNTGEGKWMQVPAGNVSDLGTYAAEQKFTGYYRPEDADIDQDELADGNVRFCANNTGNESQDHNWGETICITDGTLDAATANTAVPAVQYFVIGTPDFAMMDNIAFQPGRGNWVINEDGDGPEVGRNNDIWDCLGDGEDADGLSDGCIRVATLNDLTAESTGGIFDADGDSYYVSIQHNVTGHGVILKITGWR